MSNTAKTKPPGWLWEEIQARVTAKLGPPVALKPLPFPVPLPPLEEFVQGVRDGTISFDDPSKVD
jgi:hypothetical protein